MRALLAVMLLAASPLCWGRPALSAAWSDLWHTPDQQGQALLDAGRAAQAADRFHDPRRRAYADLQAGRYQEAAKLLEPFSDVESEYNRGNALAKAGQLQAALDAYDAALKQSPGDKAIRHNRDLVERALRQQHQSSQSRNGRQGGRKSGSSGQRQQSAAGQPNGSGSQQSAARGPQSAGRSQGAANGSQANANRQDAAGQQQSGHGGTDTSKEASGQAQRDAAAAAALARQQQQQRGRAPDAAQAGAAHADTSKSGSKDGGKQPGAQSMLAGGTRTPPQKPESERQLALDQWLRQIPDSPAGLLQRKFLIEHMMKQQDNGEEPQESGP